MEECASSDPDTDCNLGCVLYKASLAICMVIIAVIQEGQFEEASSKFTSAMQKVGYRAGIGLTHVILYWLSLSQTYVII